MAEIYSKSYLTIAATRALNSQHGFLFDFPDDTVNYTIKTEQPWGTDVSQNRTFHATFQINHKTSKEKSTPLDTRAWCLQEWYLPKRLVEFCLNDIRFMCLRNVRTRFGLTNDKHTWTRTIGRGFAMKDEHNWRTVWENARDDFFQRDITRISDRLPALAGLAKMLEGRLLDVDGHKYLAGLWSTRLSEDLSWTVLDFEKDAKLIEGVPSWSWASTTATNRYIYGRPSDTYVEMVEANCTGYAHPREERASLKVKGFVVTLFLRIDPQNNDYDGRPHRSFWLNEERALTATTAEIKAKKEVERQLGTLETHFFVSDMPIRPVHTNYDVAGQPEDAVSCRVSSITRTSSSHPNDGPESSYVTPVHLLLLTKTDVSYTALVLAPVNSQSSLKGKGRQVPDEHVLHQRLGLVEMDCISGRQSGYMETADGFKAAVKTMWKANNPDARRVITIV